MPYFRPLLTFPAGSGWLWQWSLLSLQGGRSFLKPSSIPSPLPKFVLRDQCVSCRIILGKRGVFYQVAGEQVMIVSVACELEGILPKIDADGFLYPNFDAYGVCPVLN